jgi:hypothetical protein
VIHPLIAAVRRAIGEPLSATQSSYLELLDRRLRGLASAASGGDPASFAAPRASRALARRFLRPLVGSWDDGDEEIVRGHLDRWLPAGDDPTRAVAAGLLAAAQELARIEARPETLWFFLWEMETVLESGAATNRLIPGGR